MGVAVLLGTGGTGLNDGNGIGLGSTHTGGVGAFAPITTGEDAFDGGTETTGIGDVGGGDVGDPETIGQGISDGSGCGDGHAIAI